MLVARDLVRASFHQLEPLARPQALFRIDFFYLEEKLHSFFVLKKKLHNEREHFIKNNALKIRVKSPMNR